MSAKRYKFKRKRAFIDDVSDDLEAMIDIAKKNNIIISKDDMYDIWREYSESKSAGWLYFKETEVVGVIKRYGECVDES